MYVQLPLGFKFHRFSSSSIAAQQESNRVHVVCNGSPSRIRMVRRISLGMTTLPRSSILLTIPVAFILYLSPCFQYLPCYCLSEFAVYTEINFDLNNFCYSLIFRFIQKSKSEKTREKWRKREFVISHGDIFYFIFSVLHKKTPSIKSRESDKLEFIELIIPLIPKYENDFYFSLISTML